MEEAGRAWQGLGAINGWVSEGVDSGSGFEGLWLGVGLGVKLVHDDLNGHFNTYMYKNLCPTYTMMTKRQR